MLTRLIVVLSFFFASVNTLFAQQDPNEGSFKFYAVKFHSGKHFYTGEQLKDRLKNGYAAFEVRLGWQSKGKNHWESQYNYPAYGIGWYSGYVGDVDIFGSPHAVFGFASFPISKGTRNTFQLEPALGLTYNLKPFNPDHNVINDAIGSKFAVYFSLHAGGKYRLNREMDILYGEDLTHFSNGRTVTPNLGLNMMGFSAGTRYHFNSKQRKVDNALHPKRLLEVRPTFGPTSKPDRLVEDNPSLY